MISLMLALLAPSVVTPMAGSAAPAQAVQATLQSCAMEGGRWVCRYAVPDIEIVPIPGDNVVADAPAVLLGEAATAAPPTSPAAPPAAVEPDVPATRLDEGVLNEREARLVARCADAGWVSLCLPADRRAARDLKAKQDAYLEVRRRVTGLLADDRCEAAVKAALDGGYLGLARETRAFCETPTD